MQDHASFFKRQLDALTACADEFVAEQHAAMERWIEWSAETLRGGGTIWTLGNGGSAAQAQHLAAELIHRLKDDRRALPAVALGTDAAVVTAIANDDCFEQVFARQLEGLARPGDLVVAYSTSGQSPNVLAALRTCQSKGVRSIGLLGRDGGPARALCDHAIVVAGEQTTRIQEVQLFATHLFCEALEETLGLTANDESESSSVTSET